MKLRGLVISKTELYCSVSSFHLHVSVSDLYIPRIGLPFFLQPNRQTDPGNTKIAHRYTNVEIGNKAAQFREYKNRIFGTVQAEIELIFLYCKEGSNTERSFHLGRFKFHGTSRM